MKKEIVNKDFLERFGPDIYKTFFFLELLLRHSNIIADKGFNLFGECAARRAHLPPQKKRASFLFKGTVNRTTHLAAWQTHRGCQLKWTKMVLLPK